MFFLFVLIFSFNFNTNLNERPGESNKDVLVNDVNNPFTQKQIESITKLKVYDDSLGDISDYIILYEDEYRGNENKEGMFKQTYKLNLNDYDLSYVLTIYNINFNSFDRVELFEINTTVEKYLTDEEIIKKIATHYNIKVFNYEIISSNYYENVANGSYELNYIIRTTNNEKINVVVNINVNNEANKTGLYVGIATSILLIGVIVFVIYNKKKGN